MAELTEALKLEIVTRLARFETPADILADLGKRGISCDHNQIGSYDPTRTYYEAGEKWRPIFAEARKAYIEDVAAVPIANQGFRLNELNDLYHKAKQQRNYKLAAELAEQAAKESGGVFTNARDLNINDGRRVAARDMDPADRAALFGDLIRKALESMPQPAGVDAQGGTVQ